MFNQQTISGGCIPIDITFNDNSSSITQITKRSWDFGNGNNDNTGNQTSITSTYTTVGRYDVTLEIETLDGCITQFVCDDCARAGTPPVAELDTSIYPLEQCCLGSTEFINLTTAGTADFFWYQTNTKEHYGVSLSLIHI